MKYVIGFIAGIVFTLCVALFLGSTDEPRHVRVQHQVTV